MRLNYSFGEGVIHLCSRPKIRKVVLPLLILTCCSLLVFFKVKESGFADSLSAESIASQKELIIKNVLQNQERNLHEIEMELNEAVTGNKKAVDGTFKKLNAVQDELTRLSSDFSTTDIFNKYDSFFNLLEQKARLELKTYFELQNNNVTSAVAVTIPAELKTINENITSSGKKVNAGLRDFSSSFIQSMEWKSEQIRFWNILVYICVAVSFCLIGLYSYVKTRQSSESEKQAMVSVGVKENFLANMSHEIRTPLNAVLGFTNILRNTELNEDQKEYAEIIQSSGDNLLSIVNDILDLSKIEAGMLRIDEAPFRVSDIISTVESTLTPTAEEKNIKLVINIDSDVPEIVSGDAVRLTQILLNLTSNAIKFTEEGGVYLRVTPIKQVNETVTLEFLVRDTGIGIPEEKQATVFDRFEQAEASTTRRFGGTGLGLSIVKNLIDLQKGTIVLFSQPGVGSSFTVEIPYKISHETVVKSETKSIKINPVHMKNKAKILIAEDNAMNQRLIKHLMKNWAFNFDLVFNGVQAIEALKMQHYDLVLMDIQMPEMDGYSATAHIRSTLKSKIPIIAMTAHALAGEKEKCLKAGMDNYLSKPINEEALYQMILQYSPAETNNYTSEDIPVVKKQATVIDLNVINKYSGGDMAFRKEMIKEFIDVVPSSIHSLESAINQGNFSMIRNLAHDMKTTIHVMGLTGVIGHLLQQMVIYANSNSGLLNITQLFGEIKQVCILAVKEAAVIAA